MGAQFVIQCGVPLHAGLRMFIADVGDGVALSPGIVPGGSSQPPTAGIQSQRVSGSGKDVVAAKRLHPALARIAAGLQQQALTGRLHFESIGP